MSVVEHQRWHEERGISEPTPKLSHVGDDAASHHTRGSWKRFKRDHPYGDECFSCSGMGLDVTGKSCRSCMGRGNRFDFDYWYGHEAKFMHDFANYPHIRRIEPDLRPLVNHLLDNHSVQSRGNPLDEHLVAHGKTRVIDENIQTVLLNNDRKRVAAWESGGRSDDWTHGIRPSEQPQPRGKDPWADAGDAGLPEVNDELINRLDEELIIDDQSAGPAWPNYPGIGIMPDDDYSFRTFAERRASDAAGPGQSMSPGWSQSVDWPQDKSRSEADPWSDVDHDVTPRVRRLPLDGRRVRDVIHTGPLWPSDEPFADRPTNHAEMNNARVILGADSFSLSTPCVHCGHPYYAHRVEGDQRFEFSPCEDCDDRNQGDACPGFSERGEEGDSLRKSGHEGGPPPTAGGAPSLPDLTREAMQHLIEDHGYQSPILRRLYQKPHLILSDTPVRYGDPRFPRVIQPSSEYVLETVYQHSCDHSEKRTEHEQSDAHVKLDELAKRLDHDHTFLVHVHPLDTEGVLAHEEDEADAIDEAIEWHAAQGHRGYLVNEEDLAQMNDEERAELEESGELGYTSSGIAYDPSQVVIRPLTKRNKLKYSVQSPSRISIVLDNLDGVRFSIGVQSAVPMDSAVIDDLYRAAHLTAQRLFSEYGDVAIPLREFVRELEDWFGKLGFRHSSVRRASLDSSVLVKSLEVRVDDKPYRPAYRLAAATCIECAGTGWNGSAGGHCIGCLGLGLSLRKDAEWDPVRDVSPVVQVPPAPSDTGPGGDPWVDIGDNGVGPPYPAWTRRLNLQKWLQENQLTYPEAGPPMGGPRTDVNKLGGIKQAVPGTPPQSPGDHRGDNGVDDPISDTKGNDIERLIPAGQLTNPSRGQWSVSIDNLRKVGEDEDDEDEYGRCLVCGAYVDYCTGHGDHRVYQLHDSGIHSECYPGACDEILEPTKFSCPHCGGYGVVEAAGTDEDDEEEVKTEFCTRCRGTGYKWPLDPRLPRRQPWI